MVIHQKDGRLRISKSNHCDHQWIRGWSHSIKWLDLTYQFNWHKKLHYNPIVTYKYFIQAHAKWAVSHMHLRKIGKLPIILQYVYMPIQKTAKPHYCATVDLNIEAPCLRAASFECFGLSARDCIKRYLKPALLVFYRGSRQQIRTTSYLLSRHSAVSE